MIARTTGETTADYLSEKIWSRIGAEREAFYTVDSLGTPFSGGGFNATLRDLGRFGQLVLNEGRAGDEQVIPRAAIARLRQGGDLKAFAKSGYKTLSGWSYRGMWWVSHDDHGAFAARGVHGQTVWIDPTAQMVIVRFASHPVAANAANDSTSLPAYRAVADHLLATSPDLRLLGREWKIEDIDGRGVIDNSDATFVFSIEGRLSGSTGCNRIIGSYRRQSQQLIIEVAGTTKMLCPEALMNQERFLLGVLPKVDSFAIEGTGKLVLMTNDGATISAYPK